MSFNIAQFFIGIVKIDFDILLNFNFIFCLIFLNYFYLTYTFLYFQRISLTCFLTSFYLYLVREKQNINSRSN